MGGAEATDPLPHPDPFMSLPIRHLPVVQNWDCQGCSKCCREYEITLTDEERHRIEEQGWERHPDFRGVPLFVRKGRWWKPQYRLNHRANGACVFLSEQGRCRIHEQFGAAAKPLACRLYPFVLVPAVDHWRVGLRYACPAAASNEGRPLAEHKSELDDYAAILEQQSGLGAGTVPPPLVQPGRRMEWRDLLRFVQALLAILCNRRDNFEHRMRKCVALASLCQQARFDEVQGGRLVEFINLLGASLDVEVPADPAALSPPTWAGRVLFRQAASLYMRQDHGPERGIAVEGRLGLLWAAWRFIRGRGRVPRLHGRLPETTFERGEQAAGPLPDAADLVLERYYAVKVESLQFFGATNFGLPFWEGLEALALTLPVILWLTRLLGDLPREQAVTVAVGMVDNNFGFNRLLGTARQRTSFGILARRGELEKLIAWYSR
jgi:lysine-N-methylase